MKESLDNQLVGVKWKLAQADKRVRQLRVLGQQFLDDVTKAMDWNTHDHTSGSGPDFQTALKEKVDENSELVIQPFVTIIGDADYF